MAKWTKRLLGAGVLAGLLYALWHALDQRAREHPVQWKPQPLPSPPEPVPAGTTRAAVAATAPETSAATETPAPAPAGSPAAGRAAWVEPVDGTCPASHPVKAKLGSGIFHVPGGALYDRTSPDRCYADSAAAEADGLRASKR